MDDAKSRSAHIRKMRERFHLSEGDLAELAGAPGLAEKVEEWESGASEPSAARWRSLAELPVAPPLRPRRRGEPAFRFIDLFAGIGGIRIPFQELGGQCVFTSEWDRFSKRTYFANFGDYPSGDITKIRADDIPEHDLLAAGFPCQAFSQAGRKQGFYDTRGTMFFEIQRILACKRPKAFLLENVKQLMGHDKGRTLQLIVDTLEGRNRNRVPDEVPLSADTRRALSERLDYQVFFTTLRARDFGVPQNRERIFIIGFDRAQFPGVDFERVFRWPDPPLTETSLGMILEDSASLPAHYTISNHLYDYLRRRKLEQEKKGNGFGYSLFDQDSRYTNTLSARYYKDGSEILISQEALGRNPRKLTPRECARLQGFPEHFVVDAVSEAQAYRQFGNSVTVPVIRAIARSLIKAVEEGAAAAQKSAGGRTRTAR